MALVYVQEFEDASVFRIQGRLGVARAGRALHRRTRPADDGSGSRGSSGSRERHTTDSRGVLRASRREQVVTGLSNVGLTDVQLAAALGYLRGLRHEKAEKTLQRLL